MPRESYQDRLFELRGEVAAMADRTLDRYQAAIDILATGDETRARELIDSDEAINSWYLDIEGECVELLGLQQPVASDLRFIASSFKIVTDVERIGDLVTNLAEYGYESDDELFETTVLDSIASDVETMFEGAIDAYSTDDAEAARRIASKDEEIDAQCKRASGTVVRELMTTENETFGEDDSTLDEVSRMLLTIRDFERIADHVVNICARTLYMVEHDDGLLY